MNFEHPGNLSPAGPLESVVGGVMRVPHPGIERTPTPAPHFRRCIADQHGGQSLSAIVRRRYQIDQNRLVLLEMPKERIRETLRAPKPAYRGEAAVDEQPVSIRIRSAVAEAVAK